jgi:tryptophan-rich sensory protein
MKRWDWIPTAVIALAAFGSVYVLARLVSREWGERWLALRRRPRWLQAALALALLWLALRIARLGWHALIIYLGSLAVLAAWGELAAHDRRRAGSRRP